MSNSPEVTVETTSPGIALVTGASGYVGGLLVNRLLDAGWRVRVLVRTPRQMDPRVEVVVGDAGDRRALEGALAGVDVAYWLVHAMGDADDFAAEDRRLAQTFAAAARGADVGRIVYLSGLHPEGELSPHLASRVEVGEILLASGVPTAVLQAAIVLGDGSVSFDMLRYLSSRLPAMVAPKWLNNRIQPIAIDDVLHYLLQAASIPASVNRTFDIGGPDVLTFAEMMQRFAKVTGRRRRLIITVPVLTPRLASHWIGLVTPVDTGVAEPLVDSLVHEVVCQEDDLVALVGAPPGGRTPYDEAVARAMRLAAPDTGPRNLAWSVGAVSAAAAIGALVTTPSVEWYRSLDRPAWQPPDNAFGPVWTVLFGGLAAASARTITELDRAGDVRAARYRGFFAANLVLNTAWSVLFWRMRRLDIATVEAGLLTVSGLDLVRRTASVDRSRALALAAYPAWCAFATALSGEVARRNPQEAGRARRTLSLARRVAGLATATTPVGLGFRALRAWRS